MSNRPLHRQKGRGDSTFGPVDYDLHVWQICASAKQGRHIVMLDIIRKLHVERPISNDLGPDYEKSQVHRLTPK